jgi:hypothetical protein
MKSSAREVFDRLDVKKNLGLDFYQFETHVRDFVLELIEPTVQKAAEDHQVVKDLQNGYEGLRSKLEQLVFDTGKFTKKAVTMSEFHLRVADLERDIVNNGETLTTDFAKLKQQFEVVKDKLQITQTDLAQFGKVNSTIQTQLDQMFKYIDNQK